MYTIRKYITEHKDIWDNFVNNSKNGTFLLNRDYMDYHSDRFNDFSLLFYKEDKLIAILPANINNKILYSHQGLTYGGFILSTKTTAIDIIELFKALVEFAKSNQIISIIYKAIPYIYHFQPSEEDLYAIFKVTNYRLIGRNISSVIFLEKESKIKFTQSRKGGVNKSKKNNVIISESLDFESFWNILYENLQNKYGKKPVHSLDEIKSLQHKFSQSIKLYLAELNGVTLAGVVLYINKSTVHVQYISANVKGKELGALDLLFDHLINKAYSAYKYFDFGQSTEDMGRYLNESLIFQKEGFGGRGVVYDVYELTV